MTSDGTWTYTWEHGRELASMTRDDGVNEVTITYTYDANGMRTGKTVTVNTYHTHSYSTSVTAPTCTAGGYTTYTCACGDSYQGNQTAATGHNYSSTVVESTCTASGYTVYTCTVCGYSYQDNVTAETGHSYTSTVVAPTCTATGYTLYRCSACGHSYRGNTVPKTGHDGVVLKVVEATCTTRGYTQYQCRTCGSKYMGNFVNALGHSFTMGICTRCGYKLGGSTTPVEPYPPIDGGGTMSVQGETVEPASTNATDRILESTVTTTYSYVYNGGQLVQETIATSVTENGTTTTTTDVLNYFYDASGPMSVDYNGDIYYYVTNLQGDIVAILNSSGTSVVTYTYDAWGKPLTTSGTMAETLGDGNALRYRGYVYDTESGLYYLQSRYYDPEIGRFINADAFTSTGSELLSNNMFAYCLNNPVLYWDNYGYHAELPPLVENGLNLPPSGGIPVVIDGVTYYYAVSYNSSGELYEYWFNANGDLVWARHHSNHRTPWKHDDPHDHKGGKDKNGKNTLDGGPQPIDDRYKTPDQLSNRQSHSNEALGYALAGVVAGVAIYQITKWTIATIFAPITGGGSFFAAALAP